MRIPMGSADLHMHTNHSDGRPGVRALLDHVARRGRLQVIAITDHDTIEGALQAQALQHLYSFEIIVGEEVSSRDGHILALFLRKRIAPNLSAAETVAAIHEQNGLAIAAHPFIDMPSLRARKGTGQGVGRLIGSLPFDAVEVHNSTPFLGLANYRARRFNRLNRRLPQVGNSDAHIVEAIGKSCTRFAGTTAADLRASIISSRTIAQGSRYSPRELLAYAGFWMDSLRASSRSCAERSIALD